MTFGNWTIRSFLGLYFVLFSFSVSSQNPKNYSYKTKHNVYIFQTDPLNTIESIRRIHTYSKTGITKIHFDNYYKISPTAAFQLKGTHTCTPIFSASEKAYNCITDFSVEFPDKLSEKRQREHKDPFYSLSEFEKIENLDIYIHNSKKLDNKPNSNPSEPISPTQAKAQTQNPSEPQSPVIQLPSHALAPAAASQALVAPQSLAVVAYGQEDNEELDPLADMSFLCLSFPRINLRSYFSYFFNWQNPQPEREIEMQRLICSPHSEENDE